MSFPENLTKLASNLVELADALDHVGETEKADRITTVLPKLRLLREAQYEGVNQYFLMNGRAFEKAWREKRRKKRSEDGTYHFEDPQWYRSANDCWWEVLEEYQEALMGNQEEMLARYAKKNKEVEKSDMGGGGSQPMSKAMTDFHEKVKSKGTTEGQAWVEYLAEVSRRAENVVFMEKVAERMEAGSPPGVAFYEAMDYCLSGKYVHDILKEIEVIHKDASTTKIAQNILERGLNWLGKAKDYMWGPEGGKALANLLYQIGAEQERLQGLIDKTYEVDEKGNISREPPVQPAPYWRTQIGPMAYLLEQFFGQLPETGIKFDKTKIENLLTPEEGVSNDNVYKALEYVISMSNMANHDLISRAYQGRIKPQEKQLQKPQQPAEQPAAVQPPAGQATPAQAAPTAPAGPVPTGLAPRP